MDTKLLKPEESFKRLDLYSLKNCIVLAAMFATMLFMMPLELSFPGPGLDLSWMYALNEALARHLIFGRDIVFTFGPLASVYSRMYHPATDWVMLCGSVLIGAGLTVGCALLPYPRKSVQVAILPFLVAEVTLRDSVFIFLPFVLLLLVIRVCAPADNEHRLKPSGLIYACVALVTCSVAVLPLIKGSFGGPAFFSGGLSFLVLLRRRPSAAVAFACMAIAACSSVWVATGQPIGALPAFFVAQGPIISGYSEAMPLDGPIDAVATYVAASVILLAVFYNQVATRFGKTGLIAVVSLVFALFVCFKGGFVRHDGHALIAAGALLIAAYCATAMMPSVPSVLVWVVAVYAWGFIDRSFSRLDISMVLQRVQNAVSNSYNGIKVRVSAPQQLRTIFDQRNAAIRAQLPLPSLTGSVDLYPFELSTVFAHGLDWSPRPVFQSYSAYDSRLDALNATHLRGANAPRHVFFQVQTIDDRLAALDDAGSWPALLSSYEIVSYDGLQIHLRHVDAGRSKTVFGAPVTRVKARMGSPLQLPDEDGPLWAEIDLKPTFLGRLCLFALKIPPVQITLTLEDGRMVHHRYIAAMGQRAFLLSPYIQTTDDFVSLAAGICQNNRVRSIQFDTPAAGVWKSGFSVRLRRLELNAQPMTRRMFLLQPSEPPSTIGHAETDRRSVCQIDSVNGLPAGAKESPISAQSALRLQGWCLVSPKEGISPDEVWIALTASNGQRRFYRATQQPRPDVNAFFGHPNMKTPGFVANVDLAGLTGAQELDVFEICNGVAIDCTLHRTVNIGPAN
jgi:hypothetical protein